MLEETSATSVYTLSAQEHILNTQSHHLVNIKAKPAFVSMLVNEEKTMEFVFTAFVNQPPIQVLRNHKIGSWLIRSVLRLWPDLFHITVKYN